MKSLLVLFASLIAVNALYDVPHSRPVHPHELSCPNSLCKWKPVGTLFRLSEAKPSYFVTCTNAGSVCRRCEEPLVFNTRNTACVRDFRGSKHHLKQRTAPTATTTTATESHKSKSHNKADIDCPKSLCKWKPNGALFRLRDDKPQYYVQCSNGIAYCWQCPGRQHFNNKFSVCVRRTVPVQGKW